MDIVSPFPTRSILRERVEAATPKQQGQMIHEEALRVGSLMAGAAVLAQMVVVDDWPAGSRERCDVAAAVAAIADAARAAATDLAEAIDVFRP